MSIHRSVHRFSTLIVVLAFLMSFLALTTPVYAATLFVDGVLGTNAAGCGTAPGASACQTITYTLTNVAANGDTINVASGTYSETFNINKSITLKGAQAGADARTRTAVPETILNVANLTSPIGLFVDNIVIDGFTVQSQFDNGQAGLYSVPQHSGYQVLNNIIKNNVMGFYFNASGAIQSVAKFNLFKNNNRPGAAGGNGIYEDQGLKNALIDNNTFIEDTTPPNNANNNCGILITATVAGVVANVTVSNNDLSNANAVGVLFALADTVSVTGNTFENGEFNDIQILGAVNKATISGNTFHSPIRRNVIVVDSTIAGSPGPNTNTVITNNTFNYNAGTIDTSNPGGFNTPAIIDMRSPQGTNTISGNTITLFGTSAGAAFSYFGVRLVTDTANNLPTAFTTISGNTFNGNGVAQSNGVAVNVTLATAGSLTITSNTFTNFSNGINIIAASVINSMATGNIIRFNTNGILVAESAANALTANQNCIANNTAFGESNTGTVSQNARQNWWGSPSGPSGAAPGTGDVVSANVDFSNFLAVAILGCPQVLPTSTPTGTPTTTLTSTLTPTITLTSATSSPTTTNAGTPTTTLTSTLTPTITLMSATSSPTTTNATAPTPALVADPGLTKTGNTQIGVPGDPITFTLTVTNNGTASALNVSVLDPLPNPLIFVSASASQGTFNASGNTVTFAVGTVNPGQLVTLTIVARISPQATPPNNLINVATLHDQHGNQRMASASLHITAGNLPSTGEHP